MDSQRRMRHEFEDLMQDRPLTDEEFRLLDALQVWPRAPWSVLGGVLGADPVTVSRRWERISARGLAWITAQPPALRESHGGLIEVDCAPGATEAFLEQVSDDPECLSLDVTSGARNLLLTVGCASAGAFSRYLAERIGARPGVRAVRANPVVRVIAGGDQWRLHALDKTESDQVAAAREQDLARRRAACRGRGEVDPEVARVLARDGRVTAQPIADDLGVPVRVARRALAATLASGRLALRLDMPRWATGWPVSAWYFAQVPSARLSEVGDRLRALRAVRAVFSVAGPANVMINLWLRELGEVEQFEAVIEQRLPMLHVIDRSLVLSVRKRMGRVFDSGERLSRTVPWQRTLREDAGPQAATYAVSDDHRRTGDRGLRNPGPPVR
ncbi:DNA-binding Lrp family transcriptional regulator [Amycolatopsis bartoniae]|uniref:AsnC family transcriptional regulator n=1 Tax=Amycolatopsis bartoniae TaxID=941986 RepID=A0A8H9INR5_9PSEU|nr:Lrp/AsnC family transcriptional regulator [Amycolatopsis bartoniae]MBB2940147.1 DNA-binding Lrp family transcriptional regulator [Amycolatopsis bartoniae]GHF36849.1 AsnC family transcriptional regulator [Amycolatopsis bartoniae]